MTVPALSGRVLTVAEYVALGEDDEYRFELQEGNLVMSPSPTPDHSDAMGELYWQLRRQLPAGLHVLQAVDIDLRLVAGDAPGWVRRPDLVVVDRAERERVRAERGLIRADGVRLVVEIVSPGSRRTDHVIKRGEYADAGIGHYWIVDLDGPVSLTAFRLAGELGYAESGEVTGTLSVTQPFPLSIDLDSLL